MDETGAYRGTRRADAKAATDSRGGMGDIIGQGVDAKPYNIERVCPTKKRGNVVAHATVRFGPAWIRYRIVNTERGLCVFPPSNPYPGPHGRPYYRRSAGIDEAFREQLEADVIQAYEDHIAAVGRHPPQPLERREPEPDRVRSMLEEAAQHITPEVAERVVARLGEMLDLDDLSSRERRTLATAFVRLCTLHVKEASLALKAIGYS